MVLQLLSDVGIENDWIQEMGAAENYVPDFEREGYPFVTTPQRHKGPAS